MNFTNNSERNFDRLFIIFIIIIISRMEGALSIHDPTNDQAYSQEQGGTTRMEKEGLGRMTHTLAD